MNIIGVEHAAYLEGDGKQDEDLEGMFERSETNVSLGRSLHSMMDSVDAEESRDIALEDLKAPILSEIDLVIKDLERVYVHIADQAIEHIHASEIILTFGRSSTVLHFFEEAAKRREFKVFVAESAPSFLGQNMAVELAKLGIDTTVISDSAVFAIMSRVNKVIIGTHAGNLLELFRIH